MKILVTGASGVIGRRLVPMLVADRHTVTAAGRSPERLGALARAGATAATLDIFDAGAVLEAVKGHDVVVNLATHVPPNSKAFMPGAWKEMARIRGQASGIIADAARAAGVARLIQESFAPIYPDCGDRPITEDTPPQAARYNRSVLTAEENARRFGAAGGSAVVLRFAYLYGDDDAFTAQLVGTVKRGWMALPGRRDAYFPMVTQDDAAAAVRAALDVPPGVYNVVDDEPMTREEIGAAIASMLGVAPPRFLPAWLAKLGGSLGDTLSRSQRISNARLQHASSWRPRFPSARDGLAHALGRT